MTSLQLYFIGFTFLGPVVLWAVSRLVKSPRLADGISIGLAVILVGSYAAALILKIRADLTGGDRWPIDDALPMQLCDWAAVAAIMALVSRKQTAFEVAYFWGLSGTSQALFTPAVEVDGGVRVLLFLIIHSVIVASVLWLLFEYGLRPKRGAIFRVLLWSEVYLVAALVTNAVTGGNYGFLASRPARPSMLDLFSDSHWLYVAEINLLAVVFFAVLYLPWWICQRRGTTYA